MTKDPINPTTPVSIALTNNILTATRFGALAVVDPDGAPYVTRVGLIWDGDGFLTLVSRLSTHTTALLAAPQCAVLVGEPGDKGDPLTHPRLTVQCTAAQVDKPAQKSTWLAQIPKAKLYYDFPDFIMFRLTPTAFHLNGGFGKAFRLTSADLAKN